MVRPLANKIVGQLEPDVSWLFLPASEVFFGLEAMTQLHASVKRTVGEGTRLLCRRLMSPDL